MLICDILHLQCIIMYTRDGQPVDRKQRWTSNDFQCQEDGVVAEISAKTEASCQINTETL